MVDSRQTLTAPAADCIASPGFARWNFYAKARRLPKGAPHVRNLQAWW